MEVPVALQCLHICVPIRFCPLGKAQVNLAMICVKLFRYQLGVVCFGKPLIIENYTEGLGTFFADAAHQGNQRAGVHSSREKDAKGHVAHQVVSY